jgi:serine/threonine protein kinase
MRCPQGHQWEHPVSATASASSQPARCPICGAVGEPVPANLDVPALGEVETLPPETAEQASGPVNLPAILGYEILDELGRGGMGVVYKARQVGLDRLVAVKMILSGAHAGPKERSRFRREAEAVARLQHPHIVQIYEVGEAGGNPFVSLELVDGGSLANMIDGGPVPGHRAAQLVETLARAVHSAHQRNIIHRDLKPANVLLTRDGQPKITDFGLAKRMDDGAGPTGSGEILGTPSYMAPEQTGGRSKEIGPCTDVYALGAILYALVTGRPPFQAATQLDTVLKVISDEPEPPRRLQPQLPRDLETICLKCLNKEPRDRYASAEALADDLHRFATGEAILARPLRPWERTARWIKRRREVAMLALGALAACLLLLVGSRLFQPSSTEGQSTPAPNAALSSDEDQLPKPLPPDLDLVPRDALAFVSFRVADLVASEGIKRVRKRLAKVSPDLDKMVNAILQQVEASSGLGLTDVQRFTSVALGPKWDNEPAIVVRIAEPYDPDKILDTLDARQYVKKSHLGIDYHASAEPDGPALCFFDSQTILFSSSQSTMTQLVDRIRMKSAGALRHGLELAAEGKHHVVGGFNPSAEAIQSFFGLSRLPELRPLSQCISATATVHLLSAPTSTGLADRLLIDVKLRFANQDLARQGEEVAKKAIALACEAGKKAAHDLEAELAKINPVKELGVGSNTIMLFTQETQVLINQWLLALESDPVNRKDCDVNIRLHLPIDLSKVATLPAEATSMVQVTANKAKNTNNLRQLGLAMHNYHDRYGHFPAPAILSKDGKPLLSWRVALLPLIEEENLFKQFRLDEPWDSAHNKPLLSKMPKIYMHPLETKETDTTFYQVFVGKDAVFEEKRGCSLADITDGSGNTLLIVEADEPVPWTKPVDLKYAADKPLPKLGGHFPDGFGATIADGSVLFVSRDFDEKILRQAIIRNDGAPLNLDLLKERK